MISHRSHTAEWIMDIRELSAGRDPLLVEKMIMALTLVENLRLSGLAFIFKGGTCLMLLLEVPQRFSIDIDIVLPEARNLETFFQAVVEQGVFHRYEENRRAGEVPKAHYKFFFNSVIQGTESHILLDILFAGNPYPVLQELDLRSVLLATEGAPTRVTCPRLECLLGDKLTAFAPHTTGIQYGQGKELEMAKQLFDIAILFDAIVDVTLTGKTFNTIAAQELGFRGLKNFSPQAVLEDAFETTCMIGMRGTTSTEAYAELQAGFKKLPAFIYARNYSVDSAIQDASKAALLCALLLKGEAVIPRYSKASVIADWAIINPDYSRLNKLKKTAPAAFFYFYTALQILGLLEA